jgi:hypothetical protein
LGVHLGLNAIYGIIKSIAMLVIIAEVMLLQNMQSSLYAPKKQSSGTSSRVRLSNNVGTLRIVDIMACLICLDAFFQS